MPWRKAMAAIMAWGRRFVLCGLRSGAFAQKDVVGRQDQLVAGQLFA